MFFKSSPVIPSSPGALWFFKNLICIKISSFVEAGQFVKIFREPSNGNGSSGSGQFKALKKMLTYHEFASLLMYVLIYIYFSNGINRY